MAKKTPAHHELPRFYLKGFCENSTSFLWVYVRGKDFKPGIKRSKNNPHRSGLRQAGLRADHYAIKVPGQAPDYSYELKLQQEERKADYAISKLRNKETIDSSDKAIVAHYIGLMRKRLTRRDSALLPSLEQNISQYPWDEFQRQLAFAGQFGLALQVPDAQAWFQSEHGKTKLLRDSMLKPFEDGHEALMRMTWTLLIAPGSAYFVTSDNPVVFDEQHGILNSSLLFPISKELMILAHWAQERDLEYKTLSVEQTREMNKLTIAAATKEIYASQPDEWICQGWAP